ncbi:MAG: hypothetical protein HZC54_00200 [Verrucomicrobia bacterium]|nr:hypothetical protein [Verrucomicrobiota bacterium]
MDKAGRLINEKLAADLFSKAHLEMGFKQDWLAGEIGISTRHVQDVEYGEKEPSAAIFLGCLKVTNPKLFQAVKQFIRTPTPRPQTAAVVSFPVGAGEFAS